MSKKIHSLTGGITLQVRHIDSDGYALINVGNLPKPTGNGYCLESASRYPVAELAAALGLPTREELDRKQAAWENECGNLEMTQRERDALRAELDEAEATIARVWDVIAAHRDGYLSDKIAAALDPKPAFVLPTEVPATIEAKLDGRKVNLDLLTDGDGTNVWMHWPSNESYAPGTVMDLFTGHRLIGADDDV